MKISGYPRLQMSLQASREVEQRYHFPAFLFCHHPWMANGEGWLQGLLKVQIKCLCLGNVREPHQELVLSIGRGKDLLKVHVVRCHLMKKRGNNFIKLMWESSWEKATIYKSGH